MVMSLVRKPRLHPTCFHLLTAFLQQLLLSHAFCMPDLCSEARCGGFFYLLVGWPYVFSLSTSLLVFCGKSLGIVISALFWF